MKLTEETANVASEIIQCFKGFKYFSATARLGAVMSSINLSVAKLRRYQFLLGITGALTRSVREPITVVVVIAVLYLQVEVLGEDIAPILVSTIFLYRALNSLMAVQVNLQGLYENGGSIEMLDRELRTLRQRRANRPGLLEANFNGLIEFAKVSFSYDGKKAALDEVSFSIAKGSSTAFIGQSGCGKTTVLDLLTQVAQPSNGEVTIDGLNILEFEPKSWQRLIGYVPQEPIILPESILQNVIFGAQFSQFIPKNDIEQQVQELLIQVGLQELLEDLPLGMHTCLGEGGLGLSGGQKQRLAICRELFKKPELLIFDEATSSLDKHSESMVTSVLKQLSGKITMIVVTHNPEMIDWVDNVVLLESGKVRAQGDWLRVRQGLSLSGNLS